MTCKAMKSAAIAVVAAASLLAVCSPASAAIRQGTVQDGVDNQDKTPSLDPRPERAELLSGEVFYDDAAGTITASLTYNQAPASGGYRAAVQLDAAKTCDDPETKDADTPELSITLSSSPDFEAAPTSTARLAGFEGTAEAATVITDEGRTLTATFTNAKFAGQDWRCVYGQDTGNTYNDADQLFFYFAGFEAQELTTSSATRFLGQKLGATYGTSWTADKNRWLRCPKVEFLPGEDAEPGRQLCEFRFKVGDGRSRHGTATVTLIDGYLATDYFKTGQPFTKTLKSCRVRRNLRSFNPPVLARTLRATGFVSCYDGSASLIRDVHYLKGATGRVGFHGTNRAGFEDAVVFRCKIRRRGGRVAATCRNSFGDGFVYAYRKG